MPDQNATNKHTNRKNVHFQTQPSKKFKIPSKIVICALIGGFALSILIAASVVFALRIGNTTTSKSAQKNFFVTKS